MSMSKKLLLAIIVVLLITNIATLLVWNNEERVELGNGDSKSLSQKEDVASVDGENITFQEWNQSLRNNYGKKQLQTLIDQKIVEQMADEKGIQISDKVINREISRLVAKQGVLSKSEYTALEEQWIEDIRYRYQLQLLLAEGASIPEEEITTYYNTYGDQYNFSASMQTSHILVDNMETANKIYEELEAGASFKLLAQEYSNDETTKKDGGYLGFIYTSSQFFPNGYADIAVDMKEHTYSKPFVADNGIAILYLHRKLPSIEFTYEEMKPYIKSELALQEKNQPLEAAALWSNKEIDWIYGENQ
ncbi:MULTISPECIES: peptidyl-prolyl cis-trans isomerase [Virgibacillus]|uniref:peptidylprolyl isomerase n=1 Tax=Virgibacillus massiliensis TaxID=1462526 RepID=A0A024Q624_9BACI|nr:MULTISPECIES: peptidyl-prolyl cis-trans isomerase [Virgibacillus]CDQ37752.1 Foldase protein PrsA precursor [Virgibacillus massiliensis]